MVIEPGDPAPPFRLRDLDGVERSLEDFRAEPETLLVFFKAECPTCRLCLPFLGRLHAKLPERARFVGIAENSPGEARAFAEEHGLRFPVFAEPSPWLVSSAYGLSIVPTLVRVGGDGGVLDVRVGFSRDAFLELRDRLCAGLPPPWPDPFGGEEVPLLAPG